jgi:hypothetical protein
MTATIEPLTDLSAQERVDAWLADVEAALAVRDVDRAVAKFAVDSFWRDLIAFTWNIKTLEGRSGIADMLGARLAATDPSGFRTREASAEDGGVTSAFIEFETSVGRGVGHLRLKGDECWTLLTTMQELKGHEEQKGSTRVRGAVHGSDPDTRSWAEKRHDEEASLGYATQPYTLVVGVLTEGQDRRLARVLHPRHGGAVLVEDHMPAHIRALTATSASAPWCSGRTTPRTTSARRSTRTASTSRWCSGPRRTSCGRTH